VQKLGAVMPIVMTENHPWQRRLRLLGLTQRDLSRLAGHAEIVVSKQLRGHLQKGVPHHIIALILAWEIMTDQQRAKWRSAIDRETSALPSARRHSKGTALDADAEIAALKKQVLELTKRLHEGRAPRRKP